MYQLLLGLQILFICFIFLIVYSYLIYPILLAFFVKIFKNEVLVDKNYQPTVGVVVPVYNEEKVIKKKIDNILAIDYPLDKLSIWIGSDQSSDRTNEIIRSYSDKRVHLWIAPKRGGKTEILNNLVPKVESDIVLLTDANTMHQSDCLKKMVRHFADSHIGAVIGRVKHVTQKSSEFAETVYRSFEVWQKNLESKLHSSISAFGGFYTIRKKYFKKIPFNSYSNDDVLIPMNIIRQGKRVFFVSDAISEEDITGNLEIEFKRRVRIGAGNFQAFFWLLDFLNPFKGWPVFCFFSHKVLRWFSPILILGSFITLGLLALLSNLLIYKILFLTGIVVLLFSLLYIPYKISFIRPFFYFFAMNLALFFGFFRYVTGIKSAAWSRTERE